MKPGLFFSCMGLLLSSLFLGRNKDFKKKPVAAADGFAIVELFTSEGCSSCPPADETMIRLAQEFPEHVYFLSYHVDYWDYIGWKDPFSNTAYTERQEQYSSALGVNSIYTPQAIINGKQELVGSKEAQIRAVIQNEISAVAGKKIVPEAKQKDEKEITASFKIAGTDNSSLVIALVQLKASIQIKRGENRGRKLEHINIVRQLKSLDASRETVPVIVFEIPAGLTAKDLKLVAFIQDRKTMQISGASETYIQ